MEFAVHSAQIVLIALASYLLFTVTRLVRQEGRPQPMFFMGAQEGGVSSHSRPLPRIESIAQLQMFAGSQMLELKMNGLDSQHIRRKEWLFDGVCHYFLGSCRAIGCHFRCADMDIGDMMHFVMRRHMGLEFDEASHVIESLLLAPVEAYHRDAAEAGAHAAKAWLHEKKIPKDSSLFNSISEWGMTV